MNAYDFAKQCEALAGLKTLYVKGGFGAPLNAVNKRRAEAAYEYNMKRAAIINAATPDTFAFDCCGVPKSVLWGFSADPSKNYGGAVYKSNGVPDLSEAGFLRVCTKVSSDWSNVPIGACLFMAGHMGVYLGNALAVESTPIWKDGVQITNVQNVRKISGRNGRTWSQWGLIPYVDYKEDDMTRAETEALIREMFPECMAIYTAMLSKQPADAWAMEAIERVKAAGLMVGDPDGNFRPQSPIRREEMASILAGMLPDNYIRHFL